MFLCQSKERWGGGEVGSGKELPGADTLNRLSINGVGESAGSILLQDSESTYFWLVTFEAEAMLMSDRDESYFLRSRWRNKGCA